MKKKLKKYNDISYKYAYFEPTQDFLEALNKYTNTVKNKSGLNVYQNLANWSRYFIGELFPEIKIGLYLDLDILFNKNIDDIFKTKFNVVGAIPSNLNSQKRSREIKELIGKKLDFDFLISNLFNKIDINYNKFNNFDYNCGVILINFEKYKTIDIINKLIFYFNFIGENKRFHKPSGTQYIFNFLFPDYTILEKKYNHIMKYSNYDKNAGILQFKGESLNDKYKKIYNNIIN
jgi:lipopolysaccharide biosynthesis glycosyltransferase